MSKPKRTSTDILTTSLASEVSKPKAALQKQINIKYYKQKSRILFANIGN